jgi:hypothetical protein
MAMKRVHRLAHQRERPDEAWSGPALSVATTWCASNIDRLCSSKGHRTPSMYQGPDFRPPLTRSSP